MTADGSAAVERLASSLKDLLACESGASAVEYGILTVSIAIAIIAALTTLGTAIDATFQGLADFFNGTEE